MSRKSRETTKYNKEPEQYVKSTHTWPSSFSLPGAQLEVAAGHQGVSARLPDGRVGALRVLPCQMDTCQ